MMKRRLLCCLLAMVCALTMLSACSSAPAGGSSAEAPAGSGEGPGDDWVFSRRVEIMLPSGEGTNADITIRKFSEFLEKELGVSILLTNMPGGSGVTGFTWSRDQVHDGYFFQYTSPSAIGAAVLGNFDYDFFGEVKPLAGLLDSSNIIFARKDAPFSNYEEMAAYARENDGRVSMAVQSTTGIDGASTGQFLAACDYNLNLINYESEAIVACISGQLDLIMNTYGECEAYVESGDLVPLVVIADKRIDTLPDVPCSIDVGLDATLGPWFGFTCFASTPTAAQNAFEAAVLKCAQDPEWLEFLDNMGYNTEFACDRTAFSEIMMDTAQTMKEAFAYFENITIN